MSDVAAILGVSGRGAGAGAGAGAPLFGGGRRVLPHAGDDGTPATKPKKKKISREVSALLAGNKGQEVIAPMVPVKKIALGGFKEKARGKASKRWAWKPFTSSARRDGLQLSHWVPADAEFTDYPFARFNKRSDVIKYNDYDYQEMVETDRKAMPREKFEQLQEIWPKDHTDHLFDLARRFDLRWPLIIDRWEKKPAHQPEELKKRYYQVTARILRMRRIQEQRSQPSALETFDYRYDADRLRRKQLETAFVRQNDSISDERKLLKELAATETAIRKLERRIMSGEYRAAPASSLGAGAGAGSDDVLMSSEEMFPGSDAMSVRILASKQHGPGAYPTDAASMSAPLAPPVKQAPRAQGTAARGQVQQPGQVLPDRDPFRAPVMLRSWQVAAPMDGMPADSKSLQKATLAASLLYVPERPVPTAQTLLGLSQLKREVQDAMILAKQVQELEEEVYRLEHLRKTVALTGHGAPLRTTVDSKLVSKALEAPGSREAALRAAMQYQMANQPSRSATALAASGIVSSDAAMASSAASAGAAKEVQQKVVARALARQAAQLEQAKAAEASSAPPQTPIDAAARARASLPPPTPVASAAAGAGAASGAGAPINVPATTPAPTASTPAFQVASSGPVAAVSATPAALPLASPTPLLVPLPQLGSRPSLGVSATAPGAVGGIAGTGAGLPTPLSTPAGVAAGSRPAASGAAGIASSPAGARKDGVSAMLSTPAIGTPTAASAGVAATAGAASALSKTPAVTAALPAGLAGVGLPAPTLLQPAMNMGLAPAELARLMGSMQQVSSAVSHGSASMAGMPQLPAMPAFPAGAGTFVPMPTAGASGRGSFLPSYGGLLNPTGLSALPGASAAVAGTPVGAGTTGAVAALSAAKMGAPGGAGTGMPVAAPTPVPASTPASNPAGMALPGASPVPGTPAAGAAAGAGGADTGRQTRKRKADAMDGGVATPGASAVKKGKTE